ncbi:MAG: cupin domain-containing protein [Sphingomonadales bacterium]
MQDFIERLALTPHIEGGFFKETYRSVTELILENGNKRSLATLIYFVQPQVYINSSPTIHHCIDIHAGAHRGENNDISFV